MNEQQQREPVALLMITLCLLIAPIAYYGYLSYSKISTINQTEDPFLFSASRYLYTGDWPATKNDDEMLSNFQEFKIKSNKHQGPKKVEE